MVMPDIFEKARAEFPLLKQVGENGKKLIYFDSGATSQKPNAVIERGRTYYTSENANPHRGAYALSERATAVYEEARETVARFIGATSPDEVIFTRGATESLNLVAYTHGLQMLEAGDEIVLTILEHHSNLVPWQFVAKKTGAVLKYIYCQPDGQLLWEDIERTITEKTKLVAVTGMSNVLGFIPDVKRITQLAHSRGGVVVLDGAQSVPHLHTDVQDLDVDFLAFSGHKMLSEMGIGVLYGKQKLLDEMPPFLYGGDMIEYVEEQTTTFAKAPAKFEAGTQNVSGAASLAAACDYISQFSFTELETYERELMRYADEKAREIPHIKVFGTQEYEKRGPLLLFQVDEVHPHDVATILDGAGIAIRAGHHCAQPLHRFLGIQSSCRASFSFYNTKEEVDLFLDALKNVRKWMGY